jgi:hypothetical protein
MIENAGAVGVMILNNRRFRQWFTHFGWFDSIRSIGASHTARVSKTARVNHIMRIATKAFPCDEATIAIRAMGITIGNNPGLEKETRICCARLIGQ